MQQVFQKAAQSVLNGDRNKKPEFGGGKLDGVRGVDVDGRAVITMYMHDGTKREAMIGAYNGLIAKPGERGMAPGDVHDAVKAALVEAAQA